ALAVEIGATVVVGAAVVVLAFIERVVSLAALVLVLPVSTAVTLEASDFSVTAIEPLMVLLALAWLARGMAQRDLRLAAGPFGPWLGLVLLTVLASSFAAQRVGLVYKEAIKWLELIVVYLFCLAHLRQARRQRAVLSVL